MIEIYVQTKQIQYLHVYAVLLLQEVCVLAAQAVREERPDEHVAPVAETYLTFAFLRASRSLNVNI